MKGTKTATLNITLNSVEDTKFTGGTESTTLQSEVYTGSPITKNAAQLGKLTDNTGEITLTEGKEYKVVYSSNNVNAGETVTVSIEGIGEWGGKKVIGTFNIEAATIKNTDITVPEEVEHNGAYVNASDYLNGKVTVKATTKVRKDDGTAVDKTIDVPATAYKLEYSADTTSIAVGSKLTTKLTIKDKNFGTVDGTVEASKKTTVVNKSLNADTTKVEVVGGPYKYTGKDITPTLNVTYKGEALALDRDYKISALANNKDAGEATVTIEGKGDYSGSQTVKFTIEKAKISDITIAAKTTDAAKADFTYTGEQVRPVTADFNIKLGDVDVSEYFTFAYPTSSYNNVNAGKGTITLVTKKDNKNFEAGEKTVEFDILPKEITTAMLDGNFTAWDKDGKLVNIAAADFKYDGKEKTFAELKFTPSVSQDDKGNKLVEGKDYEIRYYNNITGPTAAVYVVGIGNYTSPAAQKFTGSDVTYTKKQDFAITGVTISEDDIVVADSVYAGGLNVKPNLTITIGSKTLQEGIDYKVTVAPAYDCVNVTPSDKVLKAEIEGKGGYKTTNENNTPITVKWKIVAKDLKDTDVTAVRVNGKLNVSVMNGSVLVPASEYDVTEGTNGQVTVTAKTTSKNYVGTQTVTIKDEDIAIGTPIIDHVEVVGNTATVVLSGECDGADGYDYVISTDRDCIINKDYDAVEKNILKTEADFTYVQQDTYYAYCHAWKRVNGKKVFSKWSEAYPFPVKAITPEQPTVTSVKVSGSTVKVTYTAAASADGYDVVLGTALKSVNGEKRPVEYGKLVKKNIKKGVVTATFKNVPKGTYYAGLHAFNRTSENGKKVFSPWSNTKKVTVK